MDSALHTGQWEGMLGSYGFAALFSFPDSAVFFVHLYILNLSLGKKIYNNMV